MKTRLRLLLPLYILVLAGCGQPVGVALRASATVDPRIVNSAREKALPAGFEYQESQSVRYTVQIEVVDWTNRNVSDSGGIVLRREWYAPTASLWDPERDTSDLPERHPLELVLLDSISLPERGLPYQGQYPGDAEYPFYRDTVISISRSEDERETPVALLDWLATFESDTSEPSLAWIAGVGDMMPGRGVGRAMAKTNGIDRVFDDTLPLLRSVDLLVGNLEGAVTEGGVRTEKSYTFRFGRATLEHLKEAGFDYLSLTNNHSFDYGQAGFLDTLANFQEVGMATSGAGLDPASASAPAVFRVGDIELRVLAIGAYPRERNGFDGNVSTSVTEDRPGVLWASDSANEAISRSFSDESFDILMIHGGEEWSVAPSIEVQELFRSYLDIGADAIIGSHPHVLQGLEAAEGKLIAYSLGNFLFPGMEDTRYGEESLILRLGIHDNTIRYVDLTPVQIDGITVSIDHSGRIIERVLKQTEALNRD
jgi:poly-gamma-glutamate capsule biosynthesis protein CapA/YwtB (metallophosphatase superfamily)